MEYEHLITTIKKRREMLQVTQKTLAELADVSSRQLKQFESGKGNPTLKTLTKIGNALGMELTFQVKLTETNK
jgi:transcriptional regulator with XRE-family HTH domain